MTNNILSALNYKLLVGGVFCDLQKALIAITTKFYCPKWNFTVFLAKLTIESDGIYKIHFREC
jgi:hypothetical protein